MIELTVKVKNSERTLSQKHVIYDPVTLQTEDSFLNELVKEATGVFGEEFDDVEIKTRMSWS
jgi:hypothetical protein